MTAGDGRTAITPADDMEAANGDRRSTGTLAIGSWMLFDWAAQPFYTLITTFIFAPYFTAHFIGDPIRGPALWGYTMAAAALIVAFGSPLLGAAADARGRLKIMIGWLSVGFVAGQALLWFAEPGAQGNLALVIFALILATVTAEFSVVLNNSLMPRLAGPEKLGRISGGGWALGYAGGLISLIGFLAVFQFTNDAGQTLLGFEPLFPVDSAGREADRIVGPAAALWFAVFVMPFFLFTPDAPRRPAKGGIAVGAAFRSVGKTLQNISQYRSLAWFFAARMMFIDGLLAIFAFGGIYATALFGWQTTQLGIFGIVLSLAAGIGAALGGWMDDRFGSKAVVNGALAILIAGSLGVISVDREHVLFLIKVAQPEAGAGTGMFAGTGERVYLAFAILIGLSAGPLQSASRSLLARLAPVQNMSEFFGFFAFSGKVTAFAAPLLIGLVAETSGSLQIAMSVILIFLFGGLLAMRKVRL